jgi:hypothetical protein
MTDISLDYKLRPDVTVIRHAADSYEFRFGVWNSHSIYADLGDEIDLLGLLGELPSSAAPSAMARKYGMDAGELDELLRHLDSEKLFIKDVPDPLFSLFASHDFGRHGERSRFVIVSEGRKAALLEAGLADAGAIVSFMSGQLMEKLVAASCNVADDFDISTATVAAKAELEGSTVVFLDEVNNPLFINTLAAVCRELRCPFLPVILDGPFLHVGPMYLDPSPCFECFETRILTHIRDKAAYVAYKNSFANGTSLQKKNSGLSVCSTNIAQSLATSQCVAFHMSGSCHVADKLLSVYLPTMEFVYHDLLSVSSCKTCGVGGGEIQPATHFTLSNLGVGMRESGNT